MARRWTLRLVLSVEQDEFQGRQATRELYCMTAGRR